MTLSDDDFDQDAYCPECGRAYSDGLDRAAGVAWLVALVLVSLASALVIALCIRGLS